MSDDLIFLKLGGALLTEKHGHESLRAELLQELAAVIADWWSSSGGGMVLGHGSGSFAHVAVRKTGFLEHPGSPMALARVARAAARLNHRVVDALLAVGLPAVALPGSLLAVCEGGQVRELRAEIVRDLLDSGLLPVLYGDAAPDRSQGGAIASTEPILAGLAKVMHPRRVILATDVDGVFESDPHSGNARAIPLIIPAERDWLMDRLGGARLGATDVTGGMASKVGQMLDLVEARPEIEVRILSGRRPGALAAALAGEPGAGGSLLRAS